MDYSTCQIIPKDRAIYEDNASGKLSDERYATLGQLPYGGRPKDTFYV